MEHKLAAVLCADVKGFSYRMDLDEAGTIKRLNEYRLVVDGLIKKHEGRIANTAGDSVVAEFPSAHKAVECSVAIQQQLSTMNRELPEIEKLEFRIGLNVGDIVAKDEDILGTGVNIAARLEALAEPGGVCLSGSIYDVVRNKLPYNFVYAGEQKVKNIPDPIRVYKISFGKLKTSWFNFPLKKSIYPIGLIMLIGIAGYIYFSGTETSVNEAVPTKTPFHPKNNGPNTWMAIKKQTKNTQDWSQSSPEDIRKTLLDIFNNDTDFDVNYVNSLIVRLKEGDPDQYSEFVAESEDILSNRINTLAVTDKAQAVAMADTAYSIFPESSVLERMLVRGDSIPPGVQQAVAEAKSQINSGELTAALQTLNGIASSYAGLPDVISTRRQLETRMRQASDNYDDLKSQLTVAQNLPKPSNERKAAFRKLQGEFRDGIYTAWNDSADFSRIMGDINSEVATILSRPKAVLAEGGAIAVTSEIIPTDRPCTADLAGSGKRSRAVCADFVNSGWYGPQMVVIPAGGGFNKDFAISRYEISVQDWSKYCLVSGKCKPETDKDRLKEPMSGVSLNQIKDYLAWLSKRTGKTYRLPTKQEWTYAAEAGGKQAPRGNINCRVMLGDKILKGTAPNPVSTGDANGWGLKNYLGNVQEVVTDQSGNVAVGGAYDDPQSDCDISLQKPFAGGGDDRTGFRVVLEDLE